MVFVIDEQWRGPLWRPEKKNKASISAPCVCVMWKRQRVPNTIPFSKGKTSISHTHTHTHQMFCLLQQVEAHTHWFSPPLAATLILGAVNHVELKADFPSAQDGCWQLPSLIRMQVKTLGFAYPGREIYSVLRSSKNLSEKAYGDPTSRLTIALLFCHTLKMVHVLIRSLFC